MRRPQRIVDLWRSETWLLASFLTIGEAQGKHLALFGRAVAITAVGPWLVAFVLLFGGGAWLLFEARAFGRVWAALGADLGRRRSGL